MNYVGDTVTGFLGAAAADGVEGNVYNLGSGAGHSIGEILEQVQRVAATDKPVRREEERVRPAKSEVGRLICDYSRAAAAFGYAPSVSLVQGWSRSATFCVRTRRSTIRHLYRV